eukprot:gene4000-2855_t
MEITQSGENKRRRKKKATSKGKIILMKLITSENTTTTTKHALSVHLQTILLSKLRQDYPFSSWGSFVLYRIVNRKETQTNYVEKAKKKKTNSGRTGRPRAHAVRASSFFYFTLMPSRQNGLQRS